MFEKLEELVYKADASISDILDWMIKHKEDAYFKTEFGKDLSKHICDMYMNHSALYGDLARIHLKKYFEITGQPEKISQLLQP